MKILNSMKLLGIAAALTIGVAGCDVDVEDQGELPSVDVEGGDMPDVDVETPEVDAEMEDTEVTVPDVDVETEQTEVPVPDIDVDIPEENEQ